MSDKRYEANIIRATAVEPANNLETTSAPGVWSIDEVVELQKKNKWPTVGNTTTDVDDVFSTYLYDGNGGTQSIVNNIDLTEGGLVWTKRRDSNTNGDHTLYDTERGTGTGGRLRSNNNQQAYSPTDAVTAFNNNGFSIGADASINTNSAEYVSWTFRKAAKFFDVVTYTGDGSTTKTVSHNLDSTPAMILFKRTDASGNWVVYHANTPTSDGGSGNYTQPYLRLNGTFPTTSLGDYGNNLTPTSTVIRTPIHDTTTNTADSVNVNGATYVAYLFAHNNNDGGFGPDQDQDIIKCGSYTGAYPSDVTVDLGFEPQFIFVKNATASSNWGLFDVMRGMPLGDCNTLVADTSGAENGVLGSGEAFEATPTGFIVNSGLTAVNNAGATHIYMAIRRGPLAQPTAGTQVFAIDTAGGGPPTFTSGFPVDLSLLKNVASSSGDWNLFDRIRGDTKELNTNSSAAESTNAGTYYNQDLMTGIGTNTGTSVNTYQWMWKRAPSYFDVVAYTGTGSARTLNHNLGVAPEMIWLKQRNTSQSWDVYHAGIDASAPQDYYVQLDTTGARSNNSNRWNNTAPTSSVFTVGTAASVNGSGDTYIAYLFATVAGVSKVGSYTADGNAQNIDCGFSSGAKFVLIKRSDSTGNWFILDTARGIVAGNDPLLELNSTSAQDSGYDNMDPYNAGFTITAYGGTSPYLNISGATYIFYAIA